MEEGTCQFPGIGGGIWPQGLTEVKTVSPRTRGSWLPIDESIVVVVYEKVAGGQCGFDGFLG